MSVARGCELKGLSRSTYYDAPPMLADDTEIISRIRTVCDEFETYGYRRVGAALRHQGIVVNSKELWSKVGDGRRRGWRIVGVADLPHLQGGVIRRDGEYRCFSSLSRGS